MGYEDDLNVAISLAATVLDPPPNAINFLVNHDESIIDPIFILDAIAHVCVRTIGDAFAVACSVDTRRNEVYLFVAGRNGVSTSTIHHLHKLWDLMKTISFYSTESQKMRVRSQDTATFDSMTAETYAFLSREVYSFGYQAFRKRFLFWVEELRSTILKRSISGLPPIPLFNDFFKLISSIMACHQSVINLSEPANGPIEQRLTELIYNVDCMTKFAYGVLQTPGLYETWSKAFKWADKSILQKAIQEITYTHRAIHRLLFYAHGPDLPIYHMSLVIIPINSYTPHITSWPSSTVEWRMFRDNVYSRFNYVPASTNKTGLYHFKNPLPPQCLTVHPECALIEFLHWSSIILGSSFVPPFGYIGMSVAPCVPCDMWIRAYVAWTRYAGEFSTRSPSKRWERDCALPRLEKTVEQRVAQDVLSYFCVREERLGKILQRNFRSWRALTNNYHSFGHM